jgi:DNA-binding response OmpR family regulator
MRLLLAEDDALLGGAVQRALGRAGYAVDWVQKGSDFGVSVATHQYGFIVLDLGFPDASGESLLTRLRVKQPFLPVIVITARGGVHDRVAVLDLGADDYLVKPFDLDELTARIRSVLRRAPMESGSEGAFSHGPLQLFPKQHCATWNGQPVPLTHREFWVLETLVRKRNQVLSRAQIEEALYGWGEEVDSNAVEVYVHFLRRKLGPNVIQTVRGVGYQLAPLCEYA